MTDALLLLIAALTFTGYLLLLVESVIGRRSSPGIEEAGELSSWPSVTMVVAARNEARNIEAAVLSHLLQDYPALELIVVDDRSDDGTAEILERLAAGDPRLRVIRVEQLPPGWLGKNHALHQGAAAARGEWVLFSDADVVFEQGVVRKSVAVAERNDVDHLALAPRITGGTLPLQILVAGFVFWFTLHARPWRARNPRRSEAVGIGAFNLVRREVLERAGGFEKMRLRPDDDMMLARLLKRSGARNMLARSSGMIRVEWYSTLREAIEGLAKNTFATVEYSVPLLAGASVLFVVGTIWPFLAVALTEGITRALYVGTCALILLFAGRAIRDANLRLWLVATIPFSGFLFLYILWRSAWTILRDGGVTWRGTLYPLEELRRNRIR